MTNIKIGVNCLLLMQYWMDRSNEALMHLTIKYIVKALVMYGHFLALGGKLEG